MMQPRILRVELHVVRLDRQRPPSGIASRALTARFSSDLLELTRIARTFQRSGAPAS